MCGYSLSSTGACHHVYQLTMEIPVGLYIAFRMISSEHVHDFIHDLPCLKCDRPCVKESTLVHMYSWLQGLCKQIPYMCMNLLRKHTVRANKHNHSSVPVAMVQVQVQGCICIHEDRDLYVYMQTSTRAQKHILLVLALCSVLYMYTWETDIDTCKNAHMYNMYIETNIPSFVRR
jgi:hypothetical protein